MSEQRGLEGVTALVTGATSGIGQAAAVQLARHGAEVIVHGRDATFDQLYTANVRAPWRRSPVPGPPNSAPSASGGGRAGPPARPPSSSPPKASA